MTLGEIIAEAARRSGRADVPERALWYLKTAETMINQRLRVGKMLKQVVVTADRDGIIATPQDWQQWHDFGAAGIGAPGSVRPYETKTISYYAALPSLTAQPTNWLAEENPEIYVQALLAAIHLEGGNAEGVAAARATLDALVEGVQRADMLARYVGQSRDMRAYNAGTAR